MRTNKLDFSFEVKEIEDNGVFVGYGSTYGNIDHSGDVVDKGAFTETLKTKVPAMLWQHDSAQPIGVWESCEDTDEGLLMRGRLLVGEVKQADEAYALLKAGACKGLSIGFVPTSWQWMKDEETGESVRHLKGIDLWEVSIVTFPCNDKATINSVKSIDSIRDVEGVLREAGFSRTEAKTLISAIKAQRDADKADDDALKSAQALLDALKK